LGRLGRADDLARAERLIVVAGRLVARGRGNIVPRVSREYEEDDAEDDREDEYIKYDLRQYGGILVLEGDEDALDVVELVSDAGIIVEIVGRDEVTPSGIIVVIDVITRFFVVTLIISIESWNHFS
jgi:hypothetical protein